MYKIELYDECCSPIADGTESYFVDDITLTNAYDWPSNYHIQKLS